ncbi:MAG: BrnT family toxin [Pacificimonas sp.]
MPPIEYDPVKNAENIAKHDIALKFAPLLFAGEYIEQIDDRHDYGETRFVATGPIAEFGGRIFVAIYTWRRDKRRIISLRKANDREIRNYRNSHS